MSVKMRLNGVEAMRARLRRVAAVYPKLVAGAVYTEAEIEMTEAKARTPVDTTENAPHPGQLRDSGQVSKPIREGIKITVILSFGGLADEYAVYVHEIPPEDAYHPIGQWKYLESVLNESRPYMLARIAARVHLKDLRV